MVRKASLAPSAQEACLVREEKKDSLALLVFQVIEDFKREVKLVT